MPARLLVLLLLLAPSAAAGYEEERYSGFEDATGFHTQKKMVRDAEGALYWTYVEATGENETDVVVMLGDDELPRPHAARGGEARPSIALAADGTLWVAWTERAEDDREVFAARLVDATWADITQLSGGEGYAGFPSLAAGEDGRLHVAWYGFDGDHYQTFYREWSGGAWLPATQLSSGPQDANNPSLVLSDDGAVHVAWYKDEGRRYSVWYARRAPEGAWELPRRLPQGEGDALNVALAATADGSVHVVWDETTQNASLVMHALVGGPVTVLGEGEYPAIAPTPDGWLAVWAATNGTLMAADPNGTRVLFDDAAKGRHPGLRGPSVGDRDPRVDVLWAMPGESEYQIVLRSIGPSPAPAQAPAPALVVVLALALALALALRGSGHNR